MKKIERYDINEKWAHSGIIKVGDFCFLNYCFSRTCVGLSSMANNFAGTGGRIVFRGKVGRVDFLIVRHNKGIILY